MILEIASTHCEEVKPSRMYLDYIPIILVVLPALPANLVDSHAPKKSINPAVRLVFPSSRLGLLPRCAADI